MMVAIILISFTLLGSAFITLTYRYTIREKQDSMERNAEFIAEFTGAMTAKGGSLLDSSYQAYVSSIASISDAYVLICRMDGRVQLYSSGSIREGVAGFLRARRRLPGSTDTEWPLQRPDQSGRPVCRAALCGGPGSDAERLPGPAV